MNKKIHLYLKSAAVAAIPGKLSGLQKGFELTSNGCGKW